MKKLRKQIKESFFNPILLFLPLLIFLVVDNFYGMNVAWSISFPVALLIAVYVFYAYNRIFIWHLLFSILFLVVSFLISIAPIQYASLAFQKLMDEVVWFVFLLLFLSFRKKIERIILRAMPKLLPMSNNVNELFRVIWVLFILLAFYITTFSLIQLLGNEQINEYLKYLSITYALIIISFIVWEILRVQFIRKKLLNEEWWPIVTEHGKIVGSIQNLTSLFDNKKYMHPIVRVQVIEEGMIFLQKRGSDDLLFPTLWDTAISNHVKIGETIEECINRTAEGRYNLKGIKYIFLSNYCHETENEHHYAFLFVTCQFPDIKINADLIDQTKWWTQQQIEENLETGIFSENFMIEYDLLKRSGLLERNTYDCECRLKEAYIRQKKLEESE